MCIPNLYMKIILVGVCYGLMMVTPKIQMLQIQPPQMIILGSGAFERQFGHKGRVLILELMLL